MIRKYTKQLRATAVTLVRAMAYEKKDAGHPATVEKLFRGTNYCRRAIATISGKALSVRRSLFGSLEQQTEQDRESDRLGAPHPIPLLRAAELNHWIIDPGSGGGPQDCI
jgi:hypothetical protein